MYYYHPALLELLFVKSFFMRVRLIIASKALSTLASYCKLISE